MRRLAVALVAGTLALAGCASSTARGDTPVRVAAAADLKFAMEDIVTEFATVHPEIAVATTYGSSGTFYQQIQNGAPFDLYLSADLSYPRQLVEAGLADEADLFEYAVGRLVVWAPLDSPVDPTPGIPALLDPAARKVSIANPEHAPYGRAAVAALQTAGVYDAVAGRLVLGENVAQAAEFVQSGNAQVGIIALSLAMSPQMRDTGRWAEIPLESFPRLDQGGVVLSDSAMSDSARTLRDFLLGETGLAILKSYGFYLPGT